MNYFTDKQIFYINSRNRTDPNDTHSHFSVQLNIDPNIDFDRIILLSASIPKSFYLIQEGQNTFNLQEDEDIATITIPIGNYTRSSLASIVKGLSNSSSPNLFTYNISFRNINSTYDDGKFLFTVSNNSGIQPRFIFNNFIAEQLGFRKNHSYDFVDNTLKSINVCNLVKESTIYLLSDICQGNEGSSVLQEIYTSGDASFSYINFNNYTPIEHSKPIARNKTNVYRFAIVNEDNIPIETNGININLTIMIYKNNNIFDLIKRAIKYFTLTS
jgi:hypothetical protein